MPEFYSPARRPHDEEQRQHAVDATGIVSRRGDPALPRVVAEAAQQLSAPIAAVSILDRDRQWFAARIGLESEETPRAVSFCAHAVLSPHQPLVVFDAARDSRFAGNPLVVGPPGIRFYVGMPLVSRDGYALGALCVIDLSPRTEACNLHALRALAHEAERIIEG